MKPDPRSLGRTLRNLCERRALWVSLLIALSACEPARPRPPLRQVPGGEAQRGQVALSSFGCGGCHVIPGVTGALGLVAAPLTDFDRRSFVGGVAANNPENLVQWIVDPTSFSPRTAMPNLGVPAAEARHMAAYLYAETALRK